MPGPQSSLSASSEPITRSGRMVLSMQDAEHLLGRWGQWIRQERVLGYDAINIIWWLSRKKGDGLDTHSPEYDDQTMMKIDREVANMPKKERKIVLYWYAFEQTCVWLIPRFRVSKSTIYRVLDKAKIKVKNAL